MFKRITLGSWLEAGTGKVQVVLNWKSSVKAQDHDLAGHGSFVRDLIKATLRGVSRTDLHRDLEAGNVEVGWNKAERVLEAKFS